MKKHVIAITTAVVTAFVSAFFLCVRTLQGVKEVGAFDDGEIRIVLDAGHGGVDGGVSGRTSGVKESDINLSITLNLYEKLTDMGFAVTLTRKTEAGLYGVASKGFKKRDMEKRKEIITQCDPALVLSIHQNFYAAKSVRGGQVFYRKEDERSRVLAVALQSEINALYQEEKVKPRTVMPGEYFMLQCASCPSVIVECGFLSSADEELLLDKKWQARLSEKIASGVMAFFADSVL